MEPSSAISTLVYSHKIKEKLGHKKIKVSNEKNALKCVNSVSESPSLTCGSEINHLCWSFQVTATPIGDSEQSLRSHLPKPSPTPRFQVSGLLWPSKRKL